MKTFTGFNGKTCTSINNEVHIILKGCKPRLLFKDRLHEQSYYLKKNRKTKEVEKVYIGY